MFVKCYLFSNQSIRSPEEWCWEEDRARHHGRGALGWGGKYSVVSYSHLALSLTETKAQECTKTGGRPRAPLCGSLTCCWKRKAGNVKSKRHDIPRTRQVTATVNRAPRH